MEEPIIYHFFLTWRILEYATPFNENNNKATRGQKIELYFQGPGQGHFSIAHIILPHPTIINTDKA